MANGQLEPIRFELNLAVGQNVAVFFCSRGDAPGYVERGRWPLEEKAQLQKAMPRAALELPPWGVGQNNNQRRISVSPENGAGFFGECVGTVANAKRLMRGGLAELFLCSAPSLTYA